MSAFSNLSALKYLKVALTHEMNNVFGLWLTVVAVQMQNVWSNFYWCKGRVHSEIFSMLL